MAAPQSPDDFRIFDRNLLRERRERAAKNFSDFSFLADHAAQGLAERLAETGRRFERALDLGSHAGGLARHIAPFVDTPVIRTDLAAGFLKGGSGAVVADEEALPFAEKSFDLIASSLTLHWTNDLPGTLLQARRILKRQGLFLAAILGGQTLHELRQALAEAEAEVTGGLSPRVAPFADVRDVGDLLARAGFARPVGDSEVMTVTYENAFALLRDLKGMGEASILLDRNRRIPPRALFPAMAERYARNFATPDGRIPATFEIVHLTGWVL